MGGRAVAALPTPEIAARDANLFLWAIARSIADAFLLVQLWGFSYRGLLVWRKPLGLGLAMRHECEFLLWGARSGARRPATGKAIRQIPHGPPPGRAPGGRARSRRPRPTTRGSSPRRCSPCCRRRTSTC